MEPVSAAEVATITTKVAAYGSQLAAVFHSYALAADKIPPGFEGAINILDATVATLNQVLSLLEAEAKEVKAGTTTRLFSEDGLEYALLLAKECATTLAKVEPSVANACLRAKELKARRRREKRTLAKNGPIAVDIDALILDEKDFLNIVEAANWKLASTEIEECMERLYDLQLHILLVFQVVSVGALSMDTSSGKVDVKSIVSYHDRIYRTAKLVGIKLPARRNRRSGYDSSSETISLFESSESDDESVRPERVLHGGPPPPPPVVGAGRPPPPPERWGCFPPAPVCPVPSDTTATLSSTALPVGTTINSTNPPSYSESKPMDTIPSATASTMIGSISQTSNAATVEELPDDKLSPLESLLFLDEKTPKEAQIEELDKVTTRQNIPASTASLEPRLFKSNTKSLRFKVGNVFRSNKSLAEEMRKVLSDSDSRLVAVVFTDGDMREVPHSAFHSLEATHMRTILSQLNGTEWYDTFAKLDHSEHRLLDKLLHPTPPGNTRLGLTEPQMHDRDVVVLKIIQEKKFAWDALIRDVVRKYPAHVNRVVLAIVREKLVDGKPLPLRLDALPPPPMFPIRLPPLVSGMRPPPGLPEHVNTHSVKVSDLRSSSTTWAFPPGPPITAPPVSGPPISETSPLSQFMPAAALPTPIPPPNSIPIGSVRISDTTPMTDEAAILALTTYNEYTLHQADPSPGVSRSWNKVAITQEYPEKHLIVARVNAFQREGGNALEAKLRLTEQQSAQVTRLMDQLKNGEHDVRFEWCWAEISLYNYHGAIKDMTAARSAMAVKMHLVAKRMLKAHCKPMEVYNALMRGTLAAPSAPYPGGPPPLPGVVMMNRIPSRPRKSRSRRRSRYEIDSDSESTAATSLWSDDSDSSVGNVRRRLRKNKIRKAVEAKWRRSDLYVDSDEESEEEDVIKIELVLKRGDDVVQALLDLWTPKMDVKGKGKEKAAVKEAKTFGQATNF